MTLALLARADQGGIAAQCWQFARNMHPERILVCWTEHTTRGRADPSIFENFGEVRTCRRAPRPMDASWLLSGASSVFTVECWYGLEIPIQAAARGVKRVVQGNPEMSGDETADVMLAPTTWRMDALHGRDVRHLPFPVDLDLFEPRLWAGARTLYHIASPAMRDRNGTELVLDACGHMRAECRLVIRGGGASPRHGLSRIGPVDITWLPHHPGMFYEAWDIEADALILPRRYGGLCLPMQEAASMGLPIISLDLEPQRDWLHPEALVPATLDFQEQMRGGLFGIYTADAAKLAKKLDALVFSTELGRELGDANYRWAEKQSWDALRPAYNELLR